MSNTTHIKNDDQVLEQAEAWAAAGNKVAIATVIRTWGSSPRPAGSQLAINEKGQLVGSVSGGCIEGEVVFHGREVIANGEPQTLRFGVTDDMAWEVGLACGGEIEIYVERLN